MARLRLALLLVPSLALALAAATPAMVQGPTSAYAEVVLDPNAPAPTPPGATGSWEYTTIGDPTAGAEGGWSTFVQVRRSVEPFDASLAIVGQQADALDGPITYLYYPTDPLLQSPIYNSLAAGRVAYIQLESDPVTGETAWAVWLDDQRLVGSEEPVVGSNGWTWVRFDGIQAATDGRVFVRGIAREPALDREYVMFAEVAQGTVLINGLDFVPGLSRRVEHVTDFDVSANGDHWVAQVRTRLAGATAVVADGAIVEFEPGFKAHTGLAVHPGFGATPGALWTFFVEPAINDRGDLVLRYGWSGDAGNHEQAHLRNGRRFTDALLTYGHIALDAQGASVLLERVASGSYRLALESVPLSPTSLEVDLDRDGVADPGVFTTRLLHAWSPEHASALHLETLITDPATTFERRVYVRVRNYRIDEAVCAATPNSTGQAGRLVATGNPSAQANEVTLLTLELPAASRGYMLLSRTLGNTPVQPPGSTGTLCLAGSIGRLQTGLFLTGSSGTASTELDLTSIPQPTGAVAAMAGDTWYAQAWFRDAIHGAPTSNFTGAVRLEFD